MRERIKLLLLSGGTSHEHTVSLKSAKEVKKHLNKDKYSIREAIISRKGLWKFNDTKKIYDLPFALEKLQKDKPDIVFISLHGSFGEDGKVQTLLESINVRYTGSGPGSSAIAIDKELSQNIFSATGLNVPKSIVFKKGGKVPNLKNILKFPVVIKPVCGGSSIGTQIITNSNKLQAALKSVWKIDDRVILQEFIRGTELTCGVIEQEQGKPIALMPTQIIPPKTNFFDYRAKYVKGVSQEITPPLIRKSLIKYIQATAVKLHKVLGCSGMSRSDFILMGNKLYVLELNTIPGLTSTSLLPQGAKAIGIDFPELLDKIINSAFKK